MIAEFLTLIFNKQKIIGELQETIKQTEKELEKLKELKPILAKISANTLRGYQSLQNAGNALNNGIKISGVGQGQKILERANKLKKLNSDADIGISNVEKRIRELEENLSSYNIRIDKLQSSIFAYQLEISRLRAKEKANSSNSKNV